MDGHTYERDAVAAWLVSSDRDPNTNQKIKDKTIRPNHALCRILESYKVKSDSSEENENPVDICNENEIPDNNDTPPTVSIPIPIKIKEKRAMKKKQRNQNMKKNSLIFAALKSHKEKINRLGYFDKSKQNNEIVEKPSYSMMHALKDGFQIIMYSRIHKMNHGTLSLHNNSRARIILGPSMVIIWHESLIHSGVKSRQIMDEKGTPNVSEDMQLFTYLWLFSAKTHRNR